MKDYFYFASQLRIPLMNFFQRDFIQDFHHKLARIFFWSGFKMRQQLGNIREIKNFNFQSK